MPVSGMHGFIEADPPRLVWILRSYPSNPGNQPAEPGLLIGWRKVVQPSPKSSGWQGLVILAPHGLAEMSWQWSNVIKPIAEEPPAPYRGPDPHGPSGLPRWV